jgi:DNA-directed RNA polymerase subunit RPC12/RpoP
MKGGNAIYCPSCSHRQAVGKAGETLALPRTVTCDKCGARLTLDKSRSGGVHVVVEPPAH